MPPYSTLTEPARGDIHEALSYVITTDFSCPRLSFRAASWPASAAMHAGNEHAGMRGRRPDDLLAEDCQSHGLGHQRGTSFHTYADAHEKRRRLDAHVPRERIHRRCAAVDCARSRQVLLDQLVHGNGPTQTWPRRFYGPGDAEP